jgi:hypothetical protein
MIMLSYLLVIDGARQIHILMQSWTEQNSADKRGKQCRSGPERVFIDR